MPPKVVLTSRKVKNVDIGIDISVPSREHASAPKNVKKYHVLVITSLPHFKSPVHSEDAVVQFMVPRDYDAFEQLQKDMLENFPQLMLPNLPRKYHLFINDADIEERQIAFDCLLKVLCRNKKMSTCPVLLEFLGFRRDAAEDYSKKRQENLKQEDAVQKTGKKDEACLFRADCMEDSVELPGGDMKFVGNSDILGRTKGKTKFPFLDEDISIPAEPSEVIDTSGHTELPEFSETVDDVLHDVLKAKKPTIAGMQDTTESNPTKIDVNSMDSDRMDTNDILTYIKSNTKNDDTFELF